MTIPSTAARIAATSMTADGVSIDMADPDRGGLGHGENIGRTYGETRSLGRSMSSKSVVNGNTRGYAKLSAGFRAVEQSRLEARRSVDSFVCPARFSPMPSDSRPFALVPHDWHSSDYVSEWITRDTTRDGERRPLLQQMLSAAPLPRDAALEVLDVGAG